MIERSKDEWYRLRLVLQASTPGGRSEAVVGLSCARSSFCGFGLIERAEIVVELCLRLARVASRYGSV